jgi:hypothetical protein
MMGAVLFGAGKETRTLDIFLGKEVLYQLSYTRMNLFILTFNNLAVS